MLGLAFWGGGNWTAMLSFMTLWSVGTHLVMPVRSSIGMELANSNAEKGRRLGQIQGVSINHIVSMSVPALGGLMWMRFGHSSVFVAAAGIAVLMALFATRVRIRPS